MNALPIPTSYRAALLAAAASAAIHGAALVSWQPPSEFDADLVAPAYSARLEPAPALQAVPVEQAAPRPRPRPKPRPRNEPRPEETVALLPEALEPTTTEFAPQEPAAAEPVQAPEEPEPPPKPEVVALAQPAVPLPAAELPAFRPEAIPEEVSISYALTSAFADGEAEYTWKRDGDRYEITGSAQATGFFTVFLEGRIDQSASGVVTPEGLRPERFSERRGNTPEEGLAFDWDAKTVEFRRGDSRRTGPLTGNTVDWLSMIFQLAHMPPRGETIDLRVYTQRRLYQYRLEVVGVEQLELPFGRANTLHLRHAGEKPEEVVDVWLGVDYHYLPVKLRYPVAKNRLVVEQTARSIKTR